VLEILEKYLEILYLKNMIQYKEINKIITMSTNLKLLKRLSKLEKKLDKLMEKRWVVKGNDSAGVKNLKYSYNNQKYMKDYYEAVNNLNKMTSNFFEEEDWTKVISRIKPTNPLIQRNVKDARYLSKLAIETTKRAEKIGEVAKLQEGITFDKERLGTVIKMIDKSEKRVQQLDKSNLHLRINEDELNEIKSGYKKVTGSLRKAYRSLFLAHSYSKKNRLFQKLRNATFPGKIKLYVVTLFKIINLSMFEMFYLPSFFSVLFSQAVGAFNAKKYSTQKKVVFIKKILNKIMPSGAAKFLAKIIKAIINIVNFIIIILTGPLKLLLGYIFYFTGMIGLALKYLFFILFNSTFYKEAERKFEPMFRKDMFAIMSMAKNFGFDPSARNLRKVFRDIISKKYNI